MAKKLYTGINDTSRNSTKLYIGVNDLSRKAKKAYIGVNNLSRLFWADSTGMNVTVTTSIRDVYSQVGNVTVTTSIRNYNP